MFTYERMDVWTCGRVGVEESESRGAEASLPLRLSGSPALRLKKTSIRPYVHTSIRWTTLLACLLALFPLGCAESVDTHLEIDRPFTVFGLINPKADTNAVRVFEIQNTIKLVRPDPIDATVTTTLMQTGETHAWQDSVIQLADGDYRHVYWAAFSASTGETYRLEVTRSDGETSTGVTTVPPPVALEILEPDTLKVREIFQPLFIRGNPPTLPRIDVEYVVVGFREGGSTPLFRPVTFNYAGKPRQQTDGWLLEIDLREDFQEIFRVFDDDSEVTTEIIDLKEIQVRVHVGDENWVSPIGVFDAEFLVEPGSFSNIDNGFGYFGSGYVESITFRPSLTLLRRAGFYTFGG